MRYASKVDGNHAEIVNGLRKLGWSVESLARVGQGCPDLLVGVPFGGMSVRTLGWHSINLGVNFLFELKAPGSAHSKAKTSGKGNSAETARRQAKWFESWRGPVWKVESLAEIIEIVTTHPRLHAAVPVIQLKDGVG